MKTKTCIIASSLIALAASMAQAQGGFTVFGESGSAPAPEQRFVRPISAPYFHEDAFITSDVRAWYVKHHFYGDTIGGDLDVYALQVRLALTPTLQFVAYKDGYSKYNDTLNNNSGWNDVGAGLKWAFLQDWEQNLHLAVGIGYELSVGDRDVLQSTRTLRLWGSANKGFDRLHLGATVNYLKANNRSDGMLGNADMITAHLHADYRVNDWFSPVVEVNGYFVTKEGPVGAPFSGVDAVSIGGGKNEDVITGAVGAEFRPFGDHIGLRGAYETQLSNSRSLFGHRWTLSAVYEF